MVLKNHSLIPDLHATFWLNAQRLVSVHCLSWVNLTTDSLIKIYWVLAFTPKYQGNFEAFHSSPSIGLLWLLQKKSVAENAAGSRSSRESFHMHNIPQNQQSRHKPPLITEQLNFAFLIYLFFDRPFFQSQLNDAKHGRRKFAVCSQGLLQDAFV